MRDCTTNTYMLILGGEVNIKEIRSNFRVTNLRNLSAEDILNYMEFVRSKGGNTDEVFLNNIETELLELIELEPTNESPEIDGSTIDQEGLVPVQVPQEFTFASRSEALKTLFRDQNALLLAFEKFISKDLIRNLFLNLRKERLITNNEQLKIDLLRYVNGLLKIIIDKPIIDISALELIKTNYYELNTVVGEILKNKSALVKLIPDSANGYDGINKMADNLELRQLVAAIIYANFNTILKEYLPIINIDSDFNGFDVENLKSLGLFTLVQRHLPKGKGFEDETKEIERSSKLLKLLITSFDPILMLADEEGKIYFEMDAEPKFALANYYYVTSILSSHINKGNYANNFDKLLTALLAYQMTTKNGVRLIDTMNEIQIGPYNLAYINLNKDLTELISNVTHRSVLATLYYNIALQKNDPIFKNIEGLEDRFSIKKYYAKYSKQQNFDKNNLADIIYSTLASITPRHYHDVLYNFDTKENETADLGLKFINKMSIGLKKSHRYLLNRTKETHEEYVKDVSPNSFTLKYQGKEITYTWSAGWNKGFQDSSYINLVYAVFYQLTDIDLSSEVLLRNTDQFRIDNVITVVHAMLNLYEKAQTAPEILELLKSEKPLENVWNAYTVPGSERMTEIFGAMGETLGRILGIYSKMTVLSRDGKPLPTFGNTAMIYEYAQRLLLLSDHLPKHEYLKGNPFLVADSHLFQGVSSKNQIVVNGVIQDYKSANLTDQIVTDIFYEWFQKRRMANNDAKINVIRFQPVVYADKTQQMTIKINSKSKITYPNFISGDSTQTFILDLNSSFKTETVAQLKEATFATLHAQYRNYFLSFDKGLSNIIKELNIDFTSELGMKASELIQLKILKIKEIRPDIFGTWIEFNPNIPLISNQYFNSNGTVNQILLFYFDLYATLSLEPTQEDRKLFNNYMNLGLIQFLSDLLDMNIDLNNSSLALLKPGHIYIDEINRILNPEIQSELLSINAKINEFVLNPQGRTLSDLNSIIESTGLAQPIENILTKVGNIYTQFFWEKEFFSHNFELTGNGPLFLHPQKGKGSTIYADVLERLGAAQKRNVTYQATTIPYIQNMITGPAVKRTVLVYKDLESHITNPLGESESVKNHDGGEYVLLLQRILENNSMPLYGNPKHHKSFIVGDVMNSEGQFFNTTLFKYASYSLNNIRLRKSKKYQNVVQTALSIEIPFLDKIDFTKDYNGNKINYSEFNISFEDDGNIFHLQSLVKTGENTYTLNYLDQSKEPISQTYQITNLFELYKILGMHKTIEMNAGKINYNDASWVALADIVNRVGFRITEAEFLNGTVEQYSRLSGNTMQDMIEARTNFADNQLNVIQPLKYAFISNFTPESCIKYGGKIGLDVKFNEPILGLNLLNLFYVHNTHLGIQQDTEHEVDTTTEVTQLINGLALGNLSPEHLDLYKDIANHVILSMTSRYKDFKLIINPNDFENDEIFLEHAKQLVFIIQKLKNQVLNSAYNAGQSLDLILASADHFVQDYIDAQRLLKAHGTELSLNEVRDLFKSSFRVSLSDLSIYNSFIVTMASINTKLGVRRKSAGTPAVMVPNSHFMTYLTVPLYSAKEKTFDYENYATLTVDEFLEFTEKRPEYKILLQPENRYKIVFNRELGIEDFNLKVFNHYIVNGEQFYVSDYKQLKLLKNAIYNGMVEDLLLDTLSGFDWKENAGRPLKPIDFEIKVSNTTGTLTRTYNIYDTVATPLLFALADYTSRLKGIDRNNPDPALLTELKEEFENIKFTLQGFNIPGFREKHINSATPAELGNILRNLLSYEYAQIKKGIKINTEEDQQFIELASNYLPDLELSDFNTVIETKFFDAEMILGYYHLNKFGINNTMHIVDVTEESLLEDIFKKVNEVDQIKLRTKNDKIPTIPIYIHTQNDNIYFFSKFNTLTTVEKLPESFIKTNEDGEKYIELELGKPLMDYIPELDDFYYIYRINNKPVLMLNLDHPVFFSNLRFWADLELSVNRNNASHEKLIWIHNVDSAKDVIYQQYLTSINDEETNKNIEAFEEMFVPVKKYELLGLDTEETRYSNLAKTLAKSKYASYLMSLRHASSRIPGQDYQSFSATRITNFLHDELNSILVSDYNVWLTGGDYDIDKLYNMGYYLTSKGTFVSWNHLFNTNTYKHLELSLDLSLPGEVKLYNAKDAPNLISLIQIYQNSGLTALLILRNYLVISKGKIRKLNQVNLENYKLFVKLYNDIIEKGLIIDDTTSLDDRDLNALIDFLEGVNFKQNQIEQALENKIVKSTRNNLKDIRNTVASYSPVTMDGPKALKLSSTNEALAKAMHPMNPIAQPRAIFNQYSGKNVVGINAAGLKLYATMSYVIASNLTKHQSASVEELKKSLFETQIVSSIVGDEIKLEVRNGFAGIEYSINKEAYVELLIQLKNQYSSMDDLELRIRLEEEIKQRLLEDYKLDRVLLQISLLLSAATDNGKEMILGIINLGEKTLGIYLYALMMGYSLDTIGKIMISEPITQLLKWTNRSILLGEKPRDLMSVVAYFFHGVNINHFIPGSAGTLLKQLQLKKAQLIKLSLNDYQEGDEKAKFASLKEIEDFVESKKDELMKTPLESSGQYDDEEEFYEEEYEFEKKLTTYNAYDLMKKFIKISKQVREINANPKHKAFLNIFSALADQSALFAATTQLLSANQGVKSTDYDLIKQIVGFEDAIRNYIVTDIVDDDVEVKLTNTNKFQQPLTKSEINILRNFTLLDFFTNEAYAKDLINLFNKVRLDLNPLDMIYKAEHFRAMITTSIQTDQLYQKHSVVYRTIRTLIGNSAKILNETLLSGKTKMIPTYSAPLTVNGITEKATASRVLPLPSFNQLKNAVDNVFLHTVLSHLQDLLIATNNPLKIEHNGETGVIVNLGQFSQIGSTLGRSEFIEFMEKTFIPRLKEGRLNAHGESDPLIKNNAFVKALTLADFRMRTANAKFFTAYGILLPKLTDDAEIKIKQSDLQEALYSLSNISGEGLYLGMSIVDLLFLYNAIVHRKKDGEFTLTLFFSPDKQPNSILNKFNEISNLVDQKFETLEITLSDLALQGFDKAMDSRININEGHFNPEYYKGIDVDNDRKSLNLVLAEAKTISEKLTVLLSATEIDNLNINFECE